MHHGIPAGDSGEFIAVTWTFPPGLAHPPGYVLLAWLGSLWNQFVARPFIVGPQRVQECERFLSGVFFADGINVTAAGATHASSCRSVFQAVHSLSLVFAVITVAVLYHTMSTMIVPTKLSSWASSLLQRFVALLLSLAVVVNEPGLRYATELEVFSLNQLLVSCGVGLTVKMMAQLVDASIRNCFSFFGAGLLFACAMCNQHALILVAAPAVVAVFSQLLFRRRVVELCVAFLLFAAGFALLAVPLLWLMQRQSHADEESSSGTSFVFGGPSSVEVLPTLLRAYYNTESGGVFSMFSNSSIGVDSSRAASVVVNPAAFASRITLHVNWLFAHGAVFIVGAVACLVISVVRPSSTTAASATSTLQSFVLLLCVVSSVVGFALLSDADFTAFKLSRSSSMVPPVLLHVHERFYLQSLPPLAVWCFTLFTRFIESFSARTVFAVVSFIFLSCALIVTMSLSFNEHYYHHLSPDDDVAGFALGLVAAAAQEARHARRPALLITSGDITFAPLLALQTIALSSSCQARAQQQRRRNPVLWLDSQLATNSWFRDRFRRVALRVCKDRARARQIADAVDAAFEQSGEIDVRALLEALLGGSASSSSSQLVSSVLLLIAPDTLRQHSPLVRGGLLGGKILLQFSSVGPLHSIDVRKKQQTAASVACPTLASTKDSNDLLRHWEQELAKLQLTPFFTAQQLFIDDNSSSSFACLNAQRRVYAANKGGRPLGSLAVTAAWDRDIVKLCAMSQHNAFVRLSAEAQAKCFSSQSVASTDLRLVAESLEKLYRSLVNRSNLVRAQRTQWKSALWMLDAEERHDIVEPFQSRFLQLSALMKSNPAAFAAAQKLVNRKP